MTNAEAYKKQLKRIKQFVRRAEKRGYEFDKLKMPKVPKRITAGSVRKLEKMSAEQLYKKATHKTETGKTVKGTEYRKQERKERARKAALTRKVKKTFGAVPVTIEGAGLPTTEAEIDKRDAEMDKYKSDPDFQRRFDAGKLAYDRISDMILEYASTGHEESAREVAEYLEGQIQQYGFEAVMYAIGEAPEDVIESAQQALKYPVGHSGHDNGMYALMALIDAGLVPQSFNTAFDDAVATDDAEEDIPFDLTEEEILSGRF